MDELSPDAREFAWDCIDGCETFRHFHDTVLAYMGRDEEWLGEELLDIWNEFWSKYQEGCPDCD